jgi:hypothetical protein
MPGLKFWPQHGAQRVTELDVVSIAAPRVRLCWWGAACNLSPTRLQGSYPVPGFRVLWRRPAFQFTVMRLVAQTPVALTPQLVSRALKLTSLRKDELLIQR